MKKILLTLTSLTTVLAIVSSAQAGSPARSNVQTGHNPPVLPAATRHAALSELASRIAQLERNGSKHLSRQQLKALGLTPASRQVVARIKRLEKHGGARAAEFGTYNYDVHRYYGNIWDRLDYSGPYRDSTEPHWLPYYTMYNNYEVCPAFATSEANCLPTHVFTSFFLLNWDASGNWYYYSPSGYNTTNQGYPTYGFWPTAG